MLRFYYFFCVWSVIPQSTSLSSRDKHFSFLPLLHSVKMTANTISEYFAQFFQVFKPSVNRRTCYVHFFFFLTLKVWKFYNGKEERIIQLFELSCHKTALFYLFLYICEWKQILLKKRGQGKLITIVLWFHFHFWRSFILPILFACFGFFGYWILAAFL